MWSIWTGLLFSYLVKDKCKVEMLRVNDKFLVSSIFSPKGYKKKKKDMVKGEILHYEKFLHFPQRFQTHEDIGLFGKVLKRNQPVFSPSKNTGKTNKNDC